MKLVNNNTGAKISPSEPLCRSLAAIHKQQIELVSKSLENDLERLLASLSPEDTETFIAIASNMVMEHPTCSRVAIRLDGITKSASDLVFECLFADDEEPAGFFTLAELKLTDKFRLLECVEYLLTPIKLF
jgi:hypothetical protein